MHGKEPGEPLLVKLIRSYMAHHIFWLQIHREAINITSAGDTLSPAEGICPLCTLSFLTEGHWMGMGAGRGSA